MAATCIMSIHINKGKTARQCIGERLDYIMNPKKTDDGILVSTYACSPETAADGWLYRRLSVCASQLSSFGSPDRSGDRLCSAAAGL